VPLVVVDGNMLKIKDFILFKVGNLEGCMPAWHQYYHGFSGGAQVGELAKLSSYVTGVINEDTTQVVKIFFYMV